MLSRRTSFELEWICKLLITADNLDMEYRRVPFHSLVHDHWSAGRERNRLGERKAVANRYREIFLHINIVFPYEPNSAYFCHANRVFYLCTSTPYHLATVGDYNALLARNVSDHSSWKKKREARKKINEASMIQNDLGAFLSVE